MRRDGSCFEWLAITNQYLSFYNVTLKSIVTINPVIKRKISLLYMSKIICIVPLAITNWYCQYPIVTLRSISIKNLVTAEGNLYNSFVILVNHECVNKFKWVVAPLFLEKGHFFKFLPKYLSFLNKNNTHNPLVIPFKRKNVT